MSRLCRFGRAFRLAILTAVSLLAPLAAAGGTVDLPRNMAELLPDDIAAILFVSSLEELVEDWSVPLGLESTDCDTCGLQGYLEANMPGYEAVIAADEPLAVTFSLMPMMMEDPVRPTLILPLQRSLSSDDPVSLEWFHLTNDGYGVHTVDPAYTPADEPPGIARDLPAGQVSLRIDIGTILSLYRPMIEMGMANLAMMATAPADTAAGSPAPPARSMTPEEVGAVRSLVSGFMDSVLMVEGSLDRRGDRAILRETMRVAPGSALDLGPQPSFDDALELSRHLDRDAALTAVWAQDSSRLVDRFQDAYLVLADAGPLDLPPEIAALRMELIEAALGNPAMRAPSALALDLEGREASLTMIMRPEDPQAVLDDLLGVYRSFSNADLGLRFVDAGEIEIGGVVVHRLREELDLERLRNLRPPRASAREPFLSDLHEALAGFVTAVDLCAVDGHVILLTGADDEGLESLIRSVREGRGEDDRRLVRLADRAGPDTRELVVVDLADAMRGVLELLEDHHPEAAVALVELPLDRPVPLGFALGHGETTWESLLEFDMDAAIDLIHALSGFSTHGGAPADE